MILEEIVEIYGYNDYYDSTSGYIFQLSHPAVKMLRAVGAKELMIPMADAITGEVIGKCTMQNV